MIVASEIPKGWLLVEWTRPLRTCSECKSAGHAEGWRNETDRNLFLCTRCGPAEIARKRKPKVVETAEPVPAEASKRRGRPAGSKNSVRRK
jgi:hypothetical protein